MDGPLVSPTIIVGCCKCSLCFSKCLYVLLLLYSPKVLWDASLWDVAANAVCSLSFLSAGCPFEVLVSPYAGVDTCDIWITKKPSMISLGCKGQQQHFYLLRFKSFTEVARLSVPLLSHHQ